MVSSFLLTVVFLWGFALWAGQKFHCGISTADSVITKNTLLQGFFRLLSVLSLRTVSSIERNGSVASLNENEFVAERL